MPQKQKNVQKTDLSVSKFWITFEISQLAKLEQLKTVLLIFYDEMFNIYILIKKLSVFTPPRTNQWKVALM